MTNNTTAISPTTPTTTPPFRGFTWNPYGSNSSVSTVASTISTPAAEVPLSPLTYSDPLSTTTTTGGVAPHQQQHTTAFLHHPALQHPRTRTHNPEDDICPNVVVTTRALKRALNKNKKSSETEKATQQQQQGGLAGTTTPTTPASFWSTATQQQSIILGAEQHQHNGSSEDECSSSDCNSCSHNCHYGGSSHSVSSIASSSCGAPSSSSSSACGDVSNNLPLVLRWINYARSMNSDEKVESCISGLGFQVRYRMLEVILTDTRSSVATPQRSTIDPHRPRLFVDLCTNERGNVIVQLLQHLSGDGGEAEQQRKQLFQAVVQKIILHWEELSQSQLGAIAISRIYKTLSSSTAATSDQQQELTRHILTHATNLATHRFGNFIVSEVIKVSSHSTSGQLHLSPLSNFVFAHLFEEWSHPKVFVILAESKFGSHVLEALLQQVVVMKCSASSSSSPHHPQQQYVSRLAQPLLSTPTGIDTCVKLATHKQGNYPLQALFKALVLVASSEKEEEEASSSSYSLCASLVNEAKVQVLPRIPSGSIHHKNFARALKVAGVGKK